MFGVLEFQVPGGNARPTFLRSVFAAVFTILVAVPALAASVTSQTVVFFSKALDRETTYIALLPDPPEPGKKYPTLYMLHGAWGSYRDWPTATSASAELAGRDMIAICPDGSQFGWYLDSETTRSNYETAIARDLVADVDSRFPTNATREARGIMGLSMGGHGALSLAAKHPDVFSSASSMSGILCLPNHPGKWQLDEHLGKLESARDSWTSHSVSGLVDNFTSGGVALLFDTGISDATGCLVDNRLVHELMTNRSIAHTYREFPGNHTWSYWNAHLPEHLDFHQESFGGVVRSSSNDTEETTAPDGKKKIAVGWQPGHELYKRRTLQFERENAEKWNKPGAERPIVLFGSSSFQILKEKELFASYTMANRGIGSDTVGLGKWGLLHRMNCSVYDCHPRAVFIFNGRNDLGATAKRGKPTVEEVAGCFGEVVKRIRAGVPDAHIFIVSDAPTRDKFAPIAPLMPQYNALLKKLTESGDPHITYVNIYSDLVGPDGLMKPEVSADGLHMNKAGYEILKKKFIEAMDAQGIKPN